MRQLNKEVFFAREQVVKVGRQQIEFLKERVVHNERKRIRLCAHGDVEDKVHEMFVALTRDSYIRPHKHLNKSESFHVLEGSVNAVIFDEVGKITDVIPMGDYRSGRRFYYRLPENFYHVPLITSDILVFYEATRGPFRSSDTVPAPWAPEENDAPAVKEYMQRLASAISGFVSAWEKSP